MTVNTTNFLALLVFEKENWQYGQLIKVTEFPKCESQSEQNFMQ